MQQTAISFAQFTRTVRMSQLVGAHFRMVSLSGRYVSAQGSPKTWIRGSMSNERKNRRFDFSLCLCFAGGNKFAATQGSHLPRGYVPCREAVKHSTMSEVDMYICIGICLRKIAHLNE